MFFRKNYIWIGVLCIFSLFTLSSCGKSKESTFVDTFNEVLLTKFKDPSSVKFIHAWATCDNSIVTFEVNAKNGFGGITTGMYTLVIKDIPDTSKYSTDFMTTSSFSSYFSPISLNRGEYVDRNDVGMIPVYTLKNPQLTIYYLGASGANMSEETYNIKKINEELQKYISSQGW